MLAGASASVAVETTTKILLTDTDDWLTHVTHALLRGSTCILPCGGPYILAGGVLVEETDRGIAQLINGQKGRPPNQTLAIGVPPREMPIWVDAAYRIDIENVTRALEGTGFGLIAPCSDKVPEWLRSWDETHHVYEKLMVWADAKYRSPITRLFKHIRENLGIPPEEFFLIATSANRHGMRANSRFGPAYEQLAGSRGLAYAVKDVDEDQYAAGSPLIISTLALTRARRKYWLVRGTSTDELRTRLPEVAPMSPLAFGFYRAQTRVSLALATLSRTLRQFS